MYLTKNKTKKICPINFKKLKGITSDKILEETLKIYI